MEAVFFLLLLKGLSNQTEITHVSWTLPTDSF